MGNLFIKLNFCYRDDEPAPQWGATEEIEEEVFAGISIFILLAISFIPF